MERMSTEVPEWMVRGHGRKMLWAGTLALVETEFQAGSLRQKRRGRRLGPVLMVLLWLMGMPDKG
jgi:hypothetical protein